MIPVLFSKNRLHHLQGMLPVADRVSPVRSSALPSFRSAVLPCRVPRQVLEEVHADVFKFRTDQYLPSHPHARSQESKIFGRVFLPLNASGRIFRL